jgi:hypothetical protein
MTRPSDPAPRSPRPRGIGAEKAFLDEFQYECEGDDEQGHERHEQDVGDHYVPSGTIRVTRYWAIVALRRGGFLARSGRAAVCRQAGGYCPDPVHIGRLPPLP